MLSTRDQESVLARARGETTVDLGAHFGVSHQRISAVVYTVPLRIRRRQSRRCWA